MSYQLLRETKPVARHDHGCIWCNEQIKAGEKHVQQVGKCDGDFQDSRYHPECYRAMVIDCKYEDYFQPHAFKRGTNQER